VKPSGYQMTATAIAHAGFYASFGDAVRLARDKAKLTQADLAAKLGLSRPAVANIELGRQGVLLHTALDIATSLGVSLTSDLLNAAVGAARQAEIQSLEERLAALRAEGMDLQNVHDGKGSI